MSWLITPTGPASLGFLDQYGGAAAAYSLRNLSIYNASPVVRVRRSSDNTEQDFTAAQVTDGTLATFCGAGNGFVRTWYDQSGNVNHAIQTSTDIQPQIVTNGVVDLFNSKPCLTYASSGATNLVLTQRITNVVSVFQVLRVASLGTVNQRFLLGDSLNYDYSGNGSVWLSGFFASLSVLSGNNKVNGVVTNLESTAISTNQVLISMVHAGTATVGNISKDRTFPDRSIVGSVQEILLYSDNQSSNVLLIESAINTHYAIY